MTQITMEFPDDVFAALRLSPEEFGREFRLAVATHWHDRGRISQERAAQVALSRPQFLSELARTKPDAFVVVDFEDLKREVSLG